MTQAGLIPKIVEDIRRGRATSLDAYLMTIEAAVSLNDTKTLFYMHLIAKDGNGNIRLNDFIEFIVNHIISYAIPRSKIAEAVKKDTEEGLTRHISRLHEEAKKLFTPLKKSGEGGEMLLFILGEALLGLPQLFCKMSVKTSGKVHVHGTDGIHLGVDANGKPELYWGESKLYKDFKAALKACVESIKPYLKRESGHEDLLLLQTHLDLADEKRTKAIKALLDKDNPAFNDVSYCGLCFIGFDKNLYQKSTQDNDIKEFCEECQGDIAKKLIESELSEAKIHFFCLPVTSVEEFRNLFLQRLGLNNGG